MTTRPCASIDRIDRLGLVVSSSVSVAGMRVRMIHHVCVRPSPCGSCILRILPRGPGAAIRSCIVATRLSLLARARVCVELPKRRFMRSLLPILGSSLRSPTCPPAFNCWSPMPPAVRARLRVCFVCGAAAGCLWGGCVFSLCVRRRNKAEASGQRTASAGRRGAADKPRTHPGDKQETLRRNPGDTQETLRRHLGDTQETFRTHLGHTQETSRRHPGHIQETPRRHSETPETGEDEDVHHVLVY